MIDLASTIEHWPDPSTAAVAVTTGDHTVASAGDLDRVGPVASISKLFAAMSCLVAIEEGALDLDEPAGRPGATVRHLLAHAAGYDFDQPGFAAAVGTRRVYSNVGIEVLASHLEARTGIAFADYQREAVIAPLRLASTTLVGSPAHGIETSVADLVVFGRELLAPTLVHADTLHAATTAQFPELAGVLPGWGRFDPLPWGLGFELKGLKAPHWSGTRTPPDTFGHFGGSGTYLFVDPGRQIAVAAASGTPFGDWAVEAWPATNDAILALVDR